MNNRRRTFFLGLLGGAIGLLLLSTPGFCAENDGDEPALERFATKRPAMGSTFEIVAYAATREKADAAFDAAFRHIEELDAIFSDYREDSEASRLSAASPTAKPIQVSREMAEVVGRALKLSEQSGGAFDITVGPLTRLWRRTRRQRELPTAERLQAAWAAVGYRHLRLDPEQRTLELLAANMRLDFGAIAKGFTCDQVLAALKQHGIERALVNGGGDLAIAAPPPGESGWLVGIAPLKPADPPSRFLRLSNCGIATSGDAWQFVEIDGRRYSHILDPKTGLGLPDRFSVSVIARDGTDADALATAISVLGPQRGLELADKQTGAAGLIVRVENDEPRIYTSANFPALVKPPE